LPASHPDRSRRPTRSNVQLHAAAGREHFHREGLEEKRESRVLAHPSEVVAGDPSSAPPLTIGGEDAADDPIQMMADGLDAALVLSQATQGRVIPPARIPQAFLTLVELHGWDFR